MKKRFVLLLAGCLLAMTLPMSVFSDEETKAPEKAAVEAETNATAAAGEEADLDAETKEEALTSYTAAGIELTLPEGFAFVEEDEDMLLLSADEDEGDVIMISTIPLEELGEEKLEKDAIFDLVEELLFAELEGMEKTYEVKGFNVNGLEGRYVSYVMEDIIFSMEMDMCMFLNGEEIMTVIREKIEIDLSSLESLEEGEEDDEPLTGEEEIELPSEEELPTVSEDVPVEEVKEERPLDMTRAFMSIVLSAKAAEEAEETEKAEK